LWVLSGEVQDLSELETEIFEVFGSEGIKSLGKFFGDLDIIHDDIFSDDSHVLLWALNDIKDVVEVAPVHWALVNRFANWDGLLESLNESDSSNDSSDSFVWIFIFVSFFEQIDSLVKDQRSLISFIDAYQKVGEIEGTNLSWLEESLGNLSNHVSVHDKFSILLFLFDWGLSSGSNFKDRSKIVSEANKIVLSPRFHGHSTVFLDWNTIDEEVFFESLEVLKWVSSDFISRLELLEVESGSINSFTGWETSLGLFDSGNSSDDSSNGILWVLFFVSSLELLDSSVEHQKSFILITDAWEKS